MVKSVLVSELDGSINHVYEDGSEFRLVRRANHDTVYLSSHAGCNLGCKMCWLTSTGQTSMRALKAETIVTRARPLVDMAGDDLNIAFMARGDALVNRNVDGALVRHLLALRSSTKRTKVSISTIFPKQALPPEALYLADRFGTFQPDIYWSIYSVDVDVRNKWLPRARGVFDIAIELSTWQHFTKKPVILHHALIAGVNDSWYEADDIVQLMREHGLDCRVNLVRFNSPPGSEQLEASELTYQKHREIYAKAFGAENVQIKDRVGPDVFASCGMFVNDGVGAKSRELR